MALISSPSSVYFASPKAKESSYTYAHVAGLVGPDTAYKGAAARTQAAIHNKYGPQMCAVVGLEPPDSILDHSAINK